MKGVESIQQSYNDTCEFRNHQTDAVPKGKNTVKRLSKQLHASVSLSSLVTADPPVVDFRVHIARRILAYLVKIASRVLEPTW